MSESPPMVAFAALGSNLGDREAHISGAISQLQHTPGIEFIRVSRIIETAPVGPLGQGPYLNGAIGLRTTLSPRHLLNRFLEIESAHGRNRAHSQRWGSRELDIDLLLYGDHVINEPGLHVPHPRMAERLFVLQPLAEIAPNVVHPLLGVSLQSLLDRLSAAPQEMQTSASR